MYTNCRGPHAKIVDLVVNFKRVDSSLEKLSDGLKDSVIFLYKNIKSKSNETAKFGAVSDSIYSNFKAAVNLIDSIKQIIIRAGSTGDSVLVGDIISKTITMELKTKLDNFYKASRATLSSAANITKAENIFLSINVTPSPEEFASTYFQFSKVPMAATFLSKFRVDCTDMCLLAFNDIERQLK